MTDPAAHSAVETARLTDDPHAGNIVLVGVVSLIWLAALLIGTIAMYNAYALAEEREKVHAVSPLEVRNLKNKQLSEMAVDRWINESAGVVGIPIERAIELTVRELSAGD